jgi:hypothetical protein
VEVNEAFCNYLNGLSIKTRPDKIADKDTVPCIVYQQVGGIVDQLLTEEAPLKQPIYQFSCYGNTDKEARTIYKSLYNAFKNFQGLMNGLYIQYIERMNEPIKDFEENTNRHAYKVDYTFYYQE